MFKGMNPHGQSNYHQSFLLLVIKKGRMDYPQALEQWPRVEDIQSQFTIDQY